RSTKGGDGEDARDAVRARAYGGQGRDGQGCIAAGNTSGGDGGWGAIQDSPRTAGQSSDMRSCLPNAYVEAGGSGGGTGRIRINVASAGSFQFTPGSHVSPEASTGLMTFE
ncbi:MAG TPA: hypothetical protein VM925_03845, partial [Labilithrix sp.]|nr:hypothetical protein [Labilithrix sp.]